MTVKLYITEYHSLGYGGVPGVATPLALDDANTSDQVVSATTSTQSAAFGSGTNFVRMWADSTVYIKFGTNPTATANTQPLTATTEYWRAVIPGQKVAVYDGSS